MKALKQWLNKDVKPTTKENTYTPAMGVNDAKRKQYFTTYNVELMQEIRRIKLNEDARV
jgi:hypothetical protein